MFMDLNGKFGVVTESAHLAGDEEVTREAAQLILESVIFENANDEEILELTENHRLVNDLIEMDAVEEKTIVRLDKQARISQTQKIAVFTIAKERNDPDFRKLMTVWRMEKNLEDKLMKKYGSEGLRRAKTTVQKNYRQRGNVFTKITGRAEAKLPMAAKGAKQASSKVVPPKR